MNMSDPAINIEALSTKERLDLIEQLWDSLSDDDLELTTAQKTELDRRLTDLDNDIAKGRPLGVPWESVKAKLHGE